MFFVQMLQARTLSGTGEEVKSGLAEKIAGFFDYLIGQVPSWIAGFIVFVITIFIAKLAKSAVENRISNQVDEEHQEVMVLAGRVTYFGTLVVGITVALKIAGIDLTTILAAVAFGIGFALQDFIMNFLSGVMILVSRHIVIGDFIKVGDTLGKVMEIQTRATILKSVDGTKVIVPNSEIFTSQVINMTSNPLRRVAIPLYISYDTDITYATKIAMQVIKKHPKIVKKPPPSIVVKEYGDSTIDLEARFWVGSRDGWFKVKSDLMHELWNTFMDAGIVVPYNVTHMETSQDTALEWKEAAERAKKKMEEMKLSKAMQEDASASAQAGQATQAVQMTQGPLVQNGTTPNGGANGTAIPGETAAATGASTPSVNPQLAEATVPVEPPGTYQDQIEIDGQA